MKRQQVTAFYIEALLLIVVFVGIILVLTSVFGLGKARSSDAKRLTDAVTLAANTAEAVSASDSPEALLALLDENGSARAGEGGSVLASYDADMTPAKDGLYTVEATWEPEDGDPSLVNSVVTVTCAGEAEPVYSLATAVYIGEVEP